MSSEFGPPDGDIIIRTQGVSPRDFKLHKLVLSLASPVFRDIFSLPQPISDVSRADIEIVDVTDPPEALDLVLRLIYPQFTPPNVENLNLLVEGLVIADKYDIGRARTELRSRLSKFAKENPLRVYAIAFRFGFEEEAEAAFSLTAGICLPALVDLPDDLKYIPATVYHKLVRLHEMRREEIEDAVNGVPFEAGCPECKWAKALAESTLRTKLVRTICRSEPVRVAGCIEQLGICCRGTCLRKFVDSVVAKLGSNNAVV